MNRALGVALAILIVAAGVAFHVSSRERAPLPGSPAAAHPVTAHPVTAHTADGAVVPAPMPVTPQPAPPPVPAASPAPDPVAPAGPRPTELYLTAPGLTDPGATEVFTATWVDADGYGVDGVVLLQRAEGAGWVTIAELTTSTGRASTSVTVAASAIYRLARPGGDEVSAEVAVIAETRLASALTLSASVPRVVAGGAAELTIGWHNADGVPIVGDVRLEALTGGSWAPVATLTTSAEGTAAAAVTPSAATSYRAVYPGGTRYLPVTSTDVTVTAIRAAAIPVRSCATQAEVDALPHGVGCHYTSVESGVFVVGHDFLGNAWWNELPMASYVRLTGRQAGLYEVVDRVIAPGRAGQLGPAERWACGGRCDVILQTCLGENTGFSWLRRVA